MRQSPRLFLPGALRHHRVSAPVRQVRRHPVIALFDTPPRVAIERNLGVGVEGLLMGIVFDSGTFSGLVCLEDGTMSNVGLGSLTLAFRYDVEKDVWIDTNVPEPSLEAPPEAFLG